MLFLSLNSVLRIDARQYSEQHTEELSELDAFAGCIKKRGWMAGEVNDNEVFRMTSAECEVIVVSPVRPSASCSTCLTIDH